MFAKTEDSKVRRRWRKKEERNKKQRARRRCTRNLSDNNTNSQFVCGLQVAVTHGNSLEEIAKKSHFNREQTNYTHDNYLGLRNGRNTKWRLKISLLSLFFFGNTS